MLQHGVLDKDPNVLFQCSCAEMKKFGLILGCRLSHKSQQVLTGSQNLSKAIAPHQCSCQILIPHNINVRQLLQHKDVCICRLQWN